MLAFVQSKVGSLFIWVDMGSSRGRNRIDVQDLAPALNQTWRVVIVHRRGGSQRWDL